MTATLTDIIWHPTEKYTNCRVRQFMDKHDIKTWQELVSKSTRDINWFWTAAFDYMGISWSQPYTKLLDQSGGLAWAQWFLNGKTNIVSNTLDYHTSQDTATFPNRTKAGADHPALIWECEDGSRRTLTYGELSKLAGQVASALRALGITEGDAVGIYMPMTPEVVAILFGCLKIGAVPTPVFSGFGAEPLRARMVDCQAKVIFTADAGVRKGKKIPIKADCDEAAAGLPQLQHIIVLDRFGSASHWQEGRDLSWNEIVLSAIPLEETVQLEAEAPSMYLYTSGTTGKPKGTVHTHAGALATIAKELGFAFDVNKDDVFFWFTDIGWMMGPWEMIGVAFWGGTMVIYEGAPAQPQPDKVWDVIEKNNVTILGISPTLIRVLRTFGDEWVNKHAMPTLRLLGSTGEPWDIDSYMWFFEKVGKKQCPIINISGGTELVGCLLQPLPVIPLKPCSLGVPALGMDIDVFDEEGKSVRNGIGHLVCKQPGPSMTKGFLKDNERYLETYFSKFDNIWYHGDWAKVDEDGFWFLFGRSDDTIKVAGKRIGPGEVESILVQHGAVAEAAVIGVPHEIKGETLVCFVVLMPEITGTEELRKELLDSIAHKLGTPLRPEALFFIQALPKTRSGKIVRGTIKKKYLGETITDLSSVDNPEALKTIPLKNQG